MPKHTFLALTKRPENLEHKIYGTTTDNPFRQLGGGDYLANLWLGVTAENQARADERIPILSEWIRDLKDQCVAAAVPFYLKQMEVDGKLVKLPKLDGQEWQQMPERVTL